MHKHKKLLFLAGLFLFFQWLLIIPANQIAHANQTYTYVLVNKGDTDPDSQDIGGLICADESWFDGNTTIAVKTEIDEDTVNYWCLDYTNPTKYVFIAPVTGSLPILVDGATPDVGILGGNLSNGGTGGESINIENESVFLTKYPNAEEETSVQIREQVEETVQNESDTGLASEDQPSCDREGGNFSWLMCPALELADEIISYLDNQVSTLLQVPEEYYRDSTLEEIWERFRNLAYILLIPTILIMVIGTALGFQFLDAYTVKRAMPRMVVAIIFIALSYAILTLLIDFVHVIGKGVYGLISSVVTDGEFVFELTGIFDPSPTSDVALGTALVGGALTFPIWVAAAGFLALTVLVSIATVFLLLAFRQMLIIALLILAPLAVLSWIFPGNDKPWKLWWVSFWKLLMLYPLIMALLAIGRVFAYIVDSVNPGGLIQVVLILVAYIGPFFFIPAAFKYAGGVFANIGGIVNDKERGIFDRLRKGRGNALKNSWERTQGGKAYKGNANWKRRINEGLQTGSLAGKALSSGGVSNFSDSLAREKRNKSAEELAHIMEDKEFAVWSGNDGVTGPAVQLSTKDAKGLALQYKAKALANDSELKRLKKEGDEDGYNARLAQIEPGITNTANARANELVGMVNNGKYQSALTQAFDDLSDFESTSQRDTAVSQVMAARRRYGNHGLDRALALKAMSGGTYYKNDEDTWRSAMLAAHGDDNAEADMVVKGRDILTKAGRQEGLGSFGTTLGRARAARDGKTVDENGKNIHDSFWDHVIDNNPGANLIHYSWKDGFLDENLLGRLEQRLETKAAEAAQDPSKYEDFVKEAMQLDNIYQGMANSKPKLFEKFGEKLIAKQFGTISIPGEFETVETKGPDGKVLLGADGNPIKTQVQATVSGNGRQILAKIRDTDLGQRFKKEFVDADRRKMEEALAAQQQQQRQFGQGPGGPGIEGGPGQGLF